MKRWMKYVSPYKKYFIMGPLCMIIEVIGEMFMPIFLAEIINRANRGTLTVGSSIGIAALMILTALIMMAGGVGGSYFGTKASVNFAADLRNDVYEKVQTFSFSRIDKFSTGSLVTRLTNDVTQMQNMVNMMLRMMLRSPGMLIGGIIMAIRLKPSLSLVLAVSIPILLISVGLLVYNGFSRFSRMQTKIDDLNNTVKEDITNIRVVKSFVREDHEEEKFKKANGELKDAGMNAMKIMIFMSPVMTIIMNLTTLAVIWFGGRIVLSGGMEPGDLSAFITYVTQILSSLMMVTMMFMMSSRALASAKRVGEVLDETTDLNDLYAAHPEKEVEEGTVEFKT